MNTFNELIKKICADLEIKITSLSDEWLKVLEKNHQIHYIQGYKFDLNNHGIGNIMDDKGLFFDLLSYKKIPIIEHYIIFSDYDKQKVLDYFNKNNHCLVIKGNIGTCGKEVFKVDNEKDLFTCINTLFLKEFSISLCPYYDIKNEYRVILLDKKVRIVYGKERPLIIGDGNKTLQELAREFNDYYCDKELKNGNYIPKKNEKIFLDFKFNLSQGSKMFIDIEEGLQKRIESLALKVVKELDIPFCSVDIIYTKDNKLLVMEANSGVMMDNYLRFMKDTGYLKVYNLYRDAILMMFKD